jgi:transcriptional regulator with XRE-family HTH domain
MDLEILAVARRKKAPSVPPPGRDLTLGQRLAALRRERGMTQVELAEQLGVAQPVLSDYERGELRLHGQLIIKLTGILKVSADELLGLEKAKDNGAVNNRNRRLLRRLQDLDRLPRRDQQALLRTIDAYLAKLK